MTNYYYFLIYVFIVFFTITNSQSDKDFFINNTKLCAKNDLLQLKSFNEQHLCQRLHHHQDHTHVKLPENPDYIVPVSCCWRTSANNISIINNNIINHAFARIELITCSILAIACLAKNLICLFGFYRLHLHKSLFACLVFINFTCTRVYLPVWFLSTSPAQEFICLFGFYRLHLRKHSSEAR